MPLDIGTNTNHILQNFLEYCSKNCTLKDLKMVVGASGNYSGDVDRLGKYYDLAIDTTSSNPESNDGLLTVDNEKNSVYQKMLPILEGKFKEIIFDWSVTKFIRNADLLNILPNIRDLMQLNGTLYIDEFSSCPYGGCVGILWTTKVNNKYYLQTQVYDKTVQHYTMEKRKVLKSEKDSFARERVQFGIIDYDSGNTYRNVDMYQLFDNMDEDGYFEASMFYNLVSYRDESKKLLEKVFLSDTKFNIEFCEDDKYPYNEGRIHNYWKITKNVISIKI